MNVNDTGERRRLIDFTIKTDKAPELLFTLAMEKALEIGTPEVIDRIEYQVFKMRALINKVKSNE